MLTGEKLCNLRKKEGWSQGDLADKLNISRQTVSKWELNESLPDAENIVKISNLFNVTTDYLLKDDVELSFKKNEQPAKKYYIKKMVVSDIWRNCNTWNNQYFCILLFQRILIVSILKFCTQFRFIMACNHFFNFDSSRNQYTYQRSVHIQKQKIRPAYVRNS